MDAPAVLRHGFRLIAQHVRIGYVSGLLIVDAALICVFAIDIMRFDERGFALRTALWSSMAAVTTDSVRVLAVLLFGQTLALPILTAAFRIFLGGGTRAAGLLGRRGALITSLHLASAAVLGGLYFIATGLQRAAGDAYLQGQGGMRPAFRPLLLLLVEPATLWLAAVVLVLGGLLLPLFVGTMLAREEPTPWAVDYAAITNLADLGGRFYPRHSRTRLHFNSAALAPAIHHIERRNRAAFDKYQEELPGSQSAARYLEATAELARSQLRELFPKLSGDGMHVNFFSTTSRALEVALERSPATPALLLSPYEHPAEAAVAEWVARNPARTLSRYPDQQGFFDLPWTEQKVNLLNWIASKSESVPSTLILSEVCWCTGQVLPLPEFLGELRKVAPTVSVVVDGAHAVGNGGPTVEITQVEAYLFSAHKWLMSPEPCGVLVEHGTVVRVYDQWAEGLPECIANIRSVSSLAHSLELLKEAKLERVFSRSWELRSRLLRDLGEEFELVGEHAKLQDSLLCSVRPKQNRKWRKSTRSALQSYFDAEGLNLLVIDHFGELWARLAFPYFLEARDISRAIKALKHAAQALH